MGDSDVEGAPGFAVSGATYDSFMGRYSRRLAAPFCDAARVARGLRALDVGCGPGALTAELVDRLGAPSVLACDPSPSFRDECAARHPGVEVRLGRAEEIPFATDGVDVALAQLVLHFVAEPERAVEEMIRVTRPGGRVAACVWDFHEGMEMLRAFWEAAVAIDPEAPDEAQTMRFGRAGEIAELFEIAGLTDVVDSNLRVEATYSGFGELWSGFLGSVGPAGSYCSSLSEEHRARIRDEMFSGLGSPGAELTLGAVARCAVGRLAD